MFREYAPLVQVTANEPEGMYPAPQPKTHAVPFRSAPVQEPCVTWFDPISKGSAVQSPVAAGTQAPPTADQKPVVQVTRKSPVAEKPVAQPNTHVVPDDAEAEHDPAVTWPVPTAEGTAEQLKATHVPLTADQLPVLHVVDSEPLTEYPAAQLSVHDAPDGNTPAQPPSTMWPKPTSDGPLVQGSG